VGSGNGGHLTHLTASSTQAANGCIHCTANLNPWSCRSCHVEYANAAGIYSGISRSPCASTAAATSPSRGHDARTFTTWKMLAPRKHRRVMNKADMFRLSQTIQLAKFSHCGPFTSFPRSWKGGICIQHDVFFEKRATAWRHSRRHHASPLKPSSPPVWEYPQTMIHWELQ